MSTPRTVACPHCGTPVAWTPENRWRPFCSERCRLIDLGAWANESYKIPVAEDDVEKSNAGIAEQPPKQ